MALGDNVCTPLYNGGNPAVTAHATAAITGGTFVKISATPASGPLLNTATDGSNIKVATCGAAGRAIGVAGWDAAASGDKIIVHGPGKVVPMIVGTGGVTAGQQVESDASGKPVTLASGIVNGQAETTASAGAVAYIRID